MDASLSMPYIELHLLGPKISGGDPEAGSYLSNPEESLFWKNNNFTIKNEIINCTDIVF